MKCIVAALLCVLTLVFPVAQVLAAEDEPLVSPAASSLDAARTAAVKSTLSGENVTAVYQTAFLSSGASVRKTPLGIPLGATEQERELTLGERVTVMDDRSVLSLATVAKVQKSTGDENGEEMTETELRRFTHKTIYLARGSRFFVHKGEDGLCVMLEYGSLSYAYTTDPFGAGECTLQTAELTLAAGENYVTLGTDGHTSRLLLLGGKGAAVLTAKSAQIELPSLGGYAAENGAAKAVETPLADEFAKSLQLSSLAYAMLENSAIADGAMRLVAESDPTAQINTLRDSWVKWQTEERLRRARAYEGGSEERLPLCMTVDDYLTGDYLAPLSEQNGESVWTLYYPASSAAYTVREAGRAVNLAALPSDAKLQVVLTLSVPLTDAGDSLFLTLSKLRFPVTLTQDASTYVFEISVGDVKKLYAEDASPKTLSVEYKTEKTYLFLEKETASYSLSEDLSSLEIEAKKPVTITVSLKDTLFSEDEFYLSFVAAGKKAERIAPTAVHGKENTYQFTVTPRSGANFAEVVCASVYELSVENHLKNAYSFELFGTAGEGVVRSGARALLRLLPAEESEYIPVVLQQNGEGKVALSPEEGGLYRLQPISADTVLSLSFGYPVTLPAENELYSVVPEQGYSAEYAEVGGQYRFKVHLSHDAALGTSILVKNNGVTLTPDSEGVYIIAEVTQPVRISVTHGVTYNIILPVGDNFTVSPYGGDGTTVLENGTFRFTLQMTDPEASVSQLIVAANESVITPDGGGIYTVSGIKRDVYITVRLISSFRVILPQGDGYVATPEEGSDVTVLSGGEYRFTVETDESVHPASELLVYANETQLTPDRHGVYQISDIQGDVYVTVRLRRAFEIYLPESTAEYALTPLGETTVLYGDAFSFAVEAKGMHSVSVFINGQKTTGVSGTYTVKNVYSDLYVSVTVSGETAAEEHDVLLSAEGVQAQALSALRVTDGGEFIFSVTLLSESAAADVSVEASSGTVQLKESLHTQEGGLVLLYSVQGIKAECHVRVSTAKAEG